MCHVDDPNDNVQGNVLLASLVCANTDVKPPQLTRLVQIATQRKCTSDFLARVDQSGLLIAELRRFYAELPERDRTFSPDAFFRHTIGQTGVYDGTWLVSPPNADRCIAVSAFVEILLYFIAEYKPASLEEVLEVSIVFFWVTEPIKLRWMIRK
jgi:hypothetical protein